MAPRWPQFYNGVNTLCKCVGQLTAPRRRELPHGGVGACASADNEGAVSGGRPLSTGLLAPSLKLANDLLGQLTTLAVGCLVRCKRVQGLNAEPERLLGFVGRGSLLRDLEQALRFGDRLTRRSSH